MHQFQTAALGMTVMAASQESTKPLWELSKEKGYMICYGPRTLEATKTNTEANARLFVALALVGSDQADRPVFVYMLGTCGVTLSLFCSFRACGHFRLNKESRPRLHGRPKMVRA